MSDDIKIVRASEILIARDDEIKNMFYLVKKKEDDIDDGTLELSKENIESLVKLTNKDILNLGRSVSAFLEDEIKRFNISWLELYIGSECNARSELITLFKNYYLDLGNKTMRHHFQPWIDYNAREMLAKERKKFAEFDDVPYEPEFSIGDIVTSNLEKAKEYTEIFKHFVWQMKRKALDLKVSYHLVPIMTSEQGYGKSTMFEKMFLESGVMHSIFYQEKLDVKDLNDSAKKFAVFNKLFCQFDEFKMNNEQQEQVKSLITTKKEVIRLPYGIAPLEAINYVSFIATSNKEAEKIISDSTGARRFYSMAIERSVADFRYHINNFDFKAFIRSINPYNEEGFYNGVSNIGKRNSFVDFLKEGILEELFLVGTPKHIPSTMDLKNMPIVQLKNNIYRIDGKDLIKHYYEFVRIKNHLYGKPLSKKELQELTETVLKDDDLRLQLKSVGILDIKYKVFNITNDAHGLYNHSVRGFEFQLTSDLAVQIDSERS